MSSEQRSFDVVRRGYDIEQVEKFLVMQAEAWSAELELARTRIGAMEDELRRLRPYEAEAHDLRRRAEALGAEQASADHARARIIDQANQEAQHVRTEAQREAAKLRHDAELARARIEAEARSRVADQENEARVSSNELVVEAERIMAEAVAEANRIRTEATVEAERIRDTAGPAALGPAGASLAEQHRLLEERRQRLDQDYVQAKAEYDRVMATMSAKVSELKTTHHALVTGLQAIAKGGLSQLPGADQELPTSVGDDLEEPPVDVEIPAYGADDNDGADETVHIDETVLDDDGAVETGTDEDGTVETGTVETGTDEDGTVETAIDEDGTVETAIDEDGTVETAIDGNDGSTGSGSDDSLDGDPTDDGRSFAGARDDTVDDGTVDEDSVEDVLDQDAAGEGRTVDAEQGRESEAGDDGPVVIDEDRYEGGVGWASPGAATADTPAVPRFDLSRLDDEPIHDRLVTTAPETSDVPAQMAVPTSGEPSDDLTTGGDEDDGAGREVVLDATDQHTEDDATDHDTGDDRAGAAEAGWDRWGTVADDDRSEPPRNDRDEAAGPATAEAATAPPLPPGMPIRATIRRPPSALSDWSMSTATPSVTARGGQGGEIVLHEAGDDDPDESLGRADDAGAGADPAAARHGDEASGSPILGAPPMPPRPSAGLVDRPATAGSTTDRDDADDTGGARPPWRPSPGGPTSGPGARPPSLADFPDPAGVPLGGSDEITAEVPVARPDRWASDRSADDHSTSNAGRSH